MTNEDKSRLRGLITSGDWRIIDNLRIEYCAKIMANPKARDTIDETVITTLKEEGKVEGITNFFQELFNSAK